MTIPNYLYLYIEYRNIQCYHSVSHKYPLRTVSARFAHCA